MPKCLIAIILRFDLSQSEYETAMMLETEHYNAMEY